jgi:hypothetical protein
MALRMAIGAGIVLAGAIPVACSKSDGGGAQKLATTEEPSTSTSAPCSGSVHAPEHLPPSESNMFLGGAAPPVNAHANAQELLELQKQLDAAKSAKAKPSTSASAGPAKKSKPKGNCECPPGVPICGDCT